MSKKNKEFTVADMVFKNRGLMTKGRTVFEVYESFVDGKVIDAKGVTTYLFNDGSKLTESKKLKLKKVKVDLNPIGYNPTTAPNGYTEDEMVEGSKVNISKRSRLI